MDSLRARYEVGSLWAVVVRWHAQFQAIVGEGDGLFESAVKSTQREAEWHAAALMVRYLTLDNIVEARDE